MLSRACGWIFVARGIGAGDAGDLIVPGSARRICATDAECAVQRLSRGGTPVFRAGEPNRGGDRGAGGGEHGGGGSGGGVSAAPASSDGTGRRAADFR